MSECLKEWRGPVVCGRSELPGCRAGWLVALEAHAAGKRLRLGSRNGTASSNSWCGCWMLSDLETGKR